MRTDGEATVNDSLLITVNFGARFNMQINALAISAIRDAIECNDDWDVAPSLETLHFNILRAAQNVNRFEPFSEIETALNAYLTQRMAGKRLCDYAWRLLAAC